MRGTALLSLTVATLMFSTTTVADEPIKPFGTYLGTYIGATMAMTAIADSECGDGLERTYDLDAAIQEGIETTPEHLRPEAKRLFASQGTADQLETWRNDIQGHIEEGRRQGMELAEICRRMNTHYIGYYNTRHAKWEAVKDLL